LAVHGLAPDGSLRGSGRLVLGQKPLLLPRPGDGPVLVWLGAPGYPSFLHVQRLGPDGNEQAPPAEFHDIVFYSDIRAALTPDGVLIAGEDNASSALVVVKVSTEGKQLHRAVIRTQSGSTPQLIWSGTDAKLLYREALPDDKSRTLWMRLDGNGEPIAGTRVELPRAYVTPDTQVNWEPAALLAWGEDTLAAFVNEAGTLVLARLDAKGALVGTTIPVASEGGIGDVVLTRQGTHVVVTWLLRSWLSNDERADAGRLGIAIVTP
jgi:hypothetical protein